MHIIHTMLRVGDLEKSILFYCQTLGMKLRRKKDYAEGKFTLAFIGYGEESGHEIELTYNWDVNSYEKGSGFGHIAIITEDIYALAKTISSNGGKVTREPGPMKHGKTVIAFVEDPDGYKIELIQK